MPKKSVRRSVKRRSAKRSTKRVAKRSVRRSVKKNASKRSLSKRRYSMLGGEVESEPGQGFSFYLNIKLLSGEIITVNVSPTDKIKVVKQKINQELPDVDVNAMKLFKEVDEKDEKDEKEEDKELHDELNVGHYNLQNVNFLNLFVDNERVPFFNERWIRMANRHKFKNPALEFCRRVELPLPNEPIKRYKTNDKPNVYIYQTTYEEFKKILRGSRKGEKEYQDILKKIERILLERGLPSLTTVYGFIDTYKPGYPFTYTFITFIALSEDKMVALEYRGNDDFSESSHIYINETQHSLENFIERDFRYPSTYEDLHNDEDDIQEESDEEYFNYWNEEDGDPHWLPPGWKEMKKE